MADDVVVIHLLEAMVVRRMAAQGILQDRYQERVEVYIKIVRNVMEIESVNELVACQLILGASRGMIDPMTCALVNSAALEIIETEVKEGLSKCTGFFGGNIANLERCANG